MSSTWAEGTLILYLPQGILEFELLEIGGQARYLRVGGERFTALPTLNKLWDEVVSYDDSEEVSIKGPLSFRVGTGPIIELPNDGSLVFGCDTNGEPVCSLLDRDRNCVAEHWKGLWRRQNGAENSPTIQIGLSQRLFGKDIPLPAVAAPGVRSRPSSLASRAKLDLELGGVQAQR